MKLFAPTMCPKIGRNCVQFLPYYIIIYGVYEEGETLRTDNVSQHYTDNVVNKKPPQGIPCDGSYQ